MERSVPLVSAQMRRVVGNRDFSTGQVESMTDVLCTSIRRKTATSQAETENVSS